ncbi:GID complex subunit 4, VID24 [Quaeritorhiza haematococci]|nr:GID complex subunit 4, VID24 [Quaeritorhiza haematococci]
MPVTTDRTQPHLLSDLSNPSNRKNSDLLLQQQLLLQRQLQQQRQNGGRPRQFFLLKQPCATTNRECSSLYSGSRFLGEQKSGRNSYEVTVDIQHVELRDSFLCGYLHIKGLTEDWPDLCTFFEAEVIGPKHSFLTRKWDADEKIDRDHWSKFPSFKAYDKVFNTDGFVYDFENNDFVFMRWKEHFLVPDHRIRTIAGASFAGFYYIAFQKSTGTITGFYYHENSERFQHLSLKHIPDVSFPSYEFR